MTTTIPDYLNEKFFHDALEDSLKKTIKIEDLKVIRNTIGGNYCSDIYRASVKYSEVTPTTTGTGDGCDVGDVKELKLLIKDLFENLSGSSKEYLMYKTILPEFNAILRECGVERVLSPKLYFSSKISNETHVFEDLNARNYKLCDRLLGYNEEETRMVLWKLGEFHASSIIYKEKNTEIVDKMGKFFCLEDANLMSFIDMIIKGNTDYVTKIVEKWPGYAGIAEKMRKNTGDVFRRKFLSILQKDDSEVKVIIHGDLWIKNILILETDNTVEDAVFLDYQNSCEGSPGLDINNLFMTSVQLDVIKTKHTALIRHYYESLRSTLEAGNYPTARIPTFQSILNEIQRTEYLTYYDLIFAFPQTNLSEKLAEGMNFSSFYDAAVMERVRKDVFSNRRVLDTFAYVLKRLDSLGILD